jgi:heme-degrading monooxygenase HmoA
MIASTPNPPYYAVIFTNLRTSIEDDYEKTAIAMVKLAEQHEGFLGYESVRNGMGITISYWKDLASIQRWKSHSEHLIAQNLGKEKWYSAFKIRIALVERDYKFENIIK